MTKTAVGQADDVQQLQRSTLPIMPPDFRA
jgi:hypothetical protein